MAASDTVLTGISSRSDYPGRVSRNLGQVMRKQRMAQRARSDADAAELVARLEAEIAARNAALLAMSNAETAARVYADGHEGRERLATDATLSARIDALQSASVRKFAASFGNGVLRSFDFAHGLGTRDVTVQVYSTATFSIVTPATISMPDANTVRLTFLLAVASGAHRVVVIG